MLAVTPAARLGGTNRRGRDCGEGPIAAASGGLTDVVALPYLLGICLFLFAYSLLSTFLYSSRRAGAAGHPAARERTAPSRAGDVAVNVLTLAMQVFAFARYPQARDHVHAVRHGPSCRSGFVATRAGAGARHARRPRHRAPRGRIRRLKPARETLFTCCARAEVQGENVIDTLVHRFGDTSSTWIFAGLKSAGMSLGAMTWLASRSQAPGSPVANWLGHQQSRAHRDPEDRSDPTLRRAESRV